MPLPLAPPFQQSVWEGVVCWVNRSECYVASQANFLYTGYAGNKKPPEGGWKECEMKLWKIAGGWQVTPETSTEEAHLRYLLEGLANSSNPLMAAQAGNHQPPSPSGAGCAYVSADQYRQWRESRRHKTED